MASVSSVSFAKSFRKFFNILKLDKKDISSIYIYAILAGLVQLSLPLGIQTIISFVMAGSISTSIVILIIMVVIGTFFNGLLQIRQMQIIEKVEQKIFVRYSLAFSDQLPNLNIEKLDNYYLPELVNRFFDTTSLQKGLDKILLDIPASLIQIFLGLILLAFYHPIFIGFGAVLLLIIILIIRFTSFQGLTTAMQASDYKYAIAAWLQEMARVVKSFKYYKGTTLHMHKTDKLVGGYVDARTSHFKILLTQYWSLITFKILITAAMLIVGAILLVNQQINIGQFIAADIVIISIMASVEKLMSNLDKIYDALTSVEKLSKIIDAEQEKSGHLHLAVANKGVAIEFKEVHFSYPSGTEVLNNFNCQLSAGQIVHVAGSSGAGKSTLLRLLTGAYQNFSGHIMIDNVPIGNYSIGSIRAQTGILLSQQDIFHGTLWENITMGNQSTTVEQVMELAKLIGLQYFIQSNALGFDVVLDPQGKRLPQKVVQNILLVRALLGQYRLLLLEEPFNHLNEEERNKVLQYIKKEKAATVIITSIDSNISSYCDHVLYIKNNPQ